ncbi:MAG: tRNA (adenosine(37)-N6)-dimethylallyltransferase MiaA [Chloroflexi bacterium]|nr:tRNA (adenosine(37)-N6)-dimethylallyltransferase MiaA [Chloroflexota bacterium]
MLTQRVIAVVGATATGKTALAIEVARRLGGEFEAVNADSRQVYRYMDIGTAKPTAAERAALPHRLIDIVDPDETFSLGLWLELAKEALEEVWERGRVPIVVGGTGQYVWALLEGWRVPRVPPQEELRREMEARPPEELLAELRRVDPESQEFIEPKNVRRVIRALEVYHATGKPLSHWRTKDAPRFESLVIGLRMAREALYERIDARVEAMMAGGFAEEVRGLVDRGYGCDLPSMSGIGYRELCAHLGGEMSFDEAVARTKTGTHRLARHQNTWFKAGDERIRWIEADEGASEAAAEVAAEWLGRERGDVEQESGG